MEKTVTLSLKNISVRTVTNKKIISDISMQFVSGKTYVIMGPNGSGKSTLAQVIMGNPEYKVTGKIFFDQTDISKMSTSERAESGIFLAFQSPVAIPGVSVINVLRSALGEKMSIAEVSDAIKQYAAMLHIDPSLLTRGIHDGFSGGERKKIEVLQALVLKPKFAIFDEIDTGLDVDALKIVASAIKILRKQGTGCIIITHYQRLLKYVRPDHVVVIKKGTIDKEGNASLVKEIEKKGYV